MSQELRRRLGRGLRARRKAQGFTQEELAYRADTTASVLGLIERGQDPFSCQISACLGAYGLSIRQSNIFIFSAERHADPRNADAFWALP